TDMTRLITGCLLFLTAVSAHAAGPLRVPAPHPALKWPCEIRFDLDSPVVEVQPSGNWKVIVHTEYSYDPKWGYDGLAVYLTYTNPGGEPREAIRFELPDERANGTPGKWHVEFTIAAPKPGVSVMVTAELGVKKPGEPRRTIARTTGVTQQRALA